MLNKDTDTNLFAEAVKATKEISSGYHKGLQALGANAKHICLQDTYSCTGSVDIDSCVKKLYQEDARWDYVIGYNDTAYFVEIHSANTESVSDIIKKADWLRVWLNTKAQALKAISSKELYWIPTGKCTITQRSKEIRKLSQRGISIVSSPMRIPQK